MPKASLIIPVYNVEKYIHQCLDSAINQTLDDIQIVLVDDGSPDNCPEILDKYASNDSRITVLHKQNGGVSAARNDGIEKATGEYIFFCDSDDFLEANALELMYNKALETGADIVISDFRETTGLYKKMFSNEFTTRDTDTLQVLQNSVFPKGRSRLKSREFQWGYCLGAPWHHLIRKTLIDKNQLKFDPYLRGMFDDGVFMLEVFQHAKCVSYISQVTYNYRIVEGSLTHRFNPNILNTYARIYERIDAFSAKYKKDKTFREAYYTRVFGYLNKSIAVYFLNKSNKEPEKKRYEEFCKALKSEPYATAIRELDIRNLGAVRSRLLALLLKLHQTKLFWMAKKLG